MRTSCSNSRHSDGQRRPLACCRHFVDFHGEMLLLVHWSILAYTGLVKILKKHHKRTGLLVRAPHLDNLLNQPFCSVEVRHSRDPSAGCVGICAVTLPQMMWRCSPATLQSMLRGVSHAHLAGLWHCKALQ